MNKVKLVEGKTKRFHYVVVGRNGETRSTSETYSNKSNAKRAAKKAAKDGGMEYEDAKKAAKAPVVAAEPWNANLPEASDR